MTFTRYGVWWGMWAYIAPQGNCNIDLDIYRMINGRWTLTSSSHNSAGQRDYVSDNPGWWWYDFQLVLNCSSSGNAYGEISW